MKNESRGAEMKRIIRMEEVVDFFCGKRIEKLTYGESRTAVGKMIMKQNRQASKDNMALGFKKYDLLIGLSDEKVLEDWLGLKDYIKEKLDGTEYLAVYRKKISGIYSRGEIEKQCYVSKSKYYELLSFVYSYAERYIYYHRLVRMGNENKREEPNGENTFSKQGRRTRNSLKGRVQAQSKPGAKLHDREDVHERAVEYPGSRSGDRRERRGVGCRGRGQYGERLGAYLRASFGAECNAAQSVHAYFRKESVAQSAYVVGGLQYGVRAENGELPDRNAVGQADYAGGDIQQRKSGHTSGNACGQSGDRQQFYQNILSCGGVSERERGVRDIQQSGKQYFRAEYICVCGYAR